MMGSGRGRGRTGWQPGWRVRSPGKRRPGPERLEGWVELGLPWRGATAGRGDWARLRLRSLETVQVRTVRLQVRTGARVQWGQKPGIPGRGLSPTAHLRRVEGLSPTARLRRVEGLTPTARLRRVEDTTARRPEIHMTNHRDGGTKAAPLAQRQTWLQGQRELPVLGDKQANWEPARERGLRGHDIHAAGSRIQTRRSRGARCCSPRAPAGQSPQNAWLLQAPHPFQPKRRNHGKKG